MGGGREHARLVEQGDDAGVLLLDQVQHVLVVDELDVGPVDGLALVLLLLLFEHVLVEVLLELLVGEVDAKLLKGIRLERLESVDVEDSDECLTLSVLTDTLVDLGDEPVEQSGVERLGERVPAVCGSSGVERLLNAPVPRHDGARLERLGESLRVNHHDRRGVV